MASTTSNTTTEGFSSRSNPLRIDPVYGNRRISTERRQARGPMQPMLFLILEVILIGLVVYGVNHFQLGWLTALTAVVGVYAFFASCLPRYRAAIRRQKHYQQ